MAQTKAQRNEPPLTLIGEGVAEIIEHSQIEPGVHHLTLETDEQLANAIWGETNRVIVKVYRMYAMDEGAE